MTTDHLLINHLAQLQSGHAASKGTGNGTQHRARTDTHRTSSCAGLHANTSAAST